MALKKIKPIIPYNLTVFLNHDFRGKEPFKINEKELMMRGYRVCQHLHFDTTKYIAGVNAPRRRMRRWKISKKNVKTVPKMVLSFSKHLKHVQQLFLGKCCLNYKNTTDSWTNQIAKRFSNVEMLSLHYLQRENQIKQYIIWLKYGKRVKDLSLKGKQALGQNPGNEVPKQDMRKLFLLISSLKLKTFSLASILNAESFKGLEKYLTSVVNLSLDFREPPIYWKYKYKEIHTSKSVFKQFYLKDNREDPDYKVSWKARALRSDNLDLFSEDIVSTWKEDAELNKHFLADAYSFIDSKPDFNKILTLSSVLEISKMDKLSMFYILQASVPQPHSLLSLKISFDPDLWNKNRFTPTFLNAYIPTQKMHFMKALELSIYLGTETHFSNFGKLLSLLQHLKKLRLNISFPMWLIESESFSRFFGGMAQAVQLEKLELTFDADLELKPCPTKQKAPSSAPTKPALLTTNKMTLQVRPNKKLDSYDRFAIALGSTLGNLNKIKTMSLFWKSDNLPRNNPILMAIFENISTSIYDLSVDTPFVLRAYNAESFVRVVSRLKAIKCLVLPNFKLNDEKATQLWGKWLDTLRPLLRLKYEGVDWDDLTEE